MHYLNWICHLVLKLRSKRKKHPPKSSLKGGLGTSSYKFIISQLIRKKGALIKINFLSPLGDRGTYKQALRGLFTNGTSDSVLSGNKGKGRWQTRIEIRTSAECPDNLLGRKQQNAMKGIIGKKLG
jgi:hypothetical protein